MWIEISILFPRRFHNAPSLRKYIARFWLVNKPKTRKQTQTITSPNLAGKLKAETDQRNPNLAEKPKTYKQTFTSQIHWAPLN